MAPLEQQRSGYEWFDLLIRFQGNLIVSRFVGMFVLHLLVGTILPSGPRSAIAARIRLLRFVWFFEGGEAGDSVDRIAYSWDLRAVGLGPGVSWMLPFASTQCVVCELCSRLHAGTIALSSILRIELRLSLRVSLQSDWLVRGRTPFRLSTSEAPWLRSFVPSSTSREWASCHRRGVVRIGRRWDPCCVV